MSLRSPSSSEASALAWSESTLRSGGRPITTTRVLQKRQRSSEACGCRPGGQRNWMCTRQRSVGVTHKSDSPHLGQPGLGVSPSFGSKTRRRATTVDFSERPQCPQVSRWHRYFDTLRAVAAESADLRRPGEGRQGYYLARNLLPRVTRKRPTIVREPCASPEVVGACPQGRLSIVVAEVDSTR